MSSLEGLLIAMAILGPPFSIILIFLIIDWIIAKIKGEDTFPDMLQEKQHEN